MSDWRKIEGFPDYEVSDGGEVRRITLRRDGRQHLKPPPFVLSPCLINDRYPFVRLTAPDGRKRNFTIHRLVALTFIGPPPSPAHVVAHNDGNTSNPAALNLRWATMKENQNDMLRHGTAMSGRKATGAKLTDKIVRSIRRQATGQRGEAARFARAYGVDGCHMAKILRGEIWRHLL